jgi:hypothetical protein
MFEEVFQKVSQKLTTKVTTSSPVSRLMVLRSIPAAS